MGELPKPYYHGAGITIYHADALDILPHLSGVAGVVTDPPYSSGGAFRGDRMDATLNKYVHSDSGNLARLDNFSGDNRDQRSFLVWCTLWLNAARHAAVPGAVVASFTDWRQLPTMTDAVQAGGWVWRGIAVWSKGFGRPTPGRFSNAAEYVVWGSHGPLPERDAYPPGIFESQPQREREHIAQKPEPVMRWLLRAVPPIGAVLDPFMGTGTTLRAAKDAGLPAIGIEVSEAYCEMAARRLQQGVLAFGAEEVPA